MSEIVGTRRVAFPYTPPERSIQLIGPTEAVVTAAEHGCDAVVSVGDFSLATIRTALAVPAIGSGQAGMAAAAAQGRFKL